MNQRMKHTPASSQILPPGPLAQMTSGPSCCVPDEPCHACLLTCLRRILPLVEARLRRNFPRSIAQDAIEIAETFGIEAILSGKAAGMSSSARRRWLYVIAYRRAVTLSRRPRPVTIFPDDLPSRDSRTNPDPAAVRAAVEHLPVELREVIERIYFDRCKLRSLARLCGIPESTIRRRHKRALALLREKLNHLQ